MENDLIKELRDSKDINNAMQEILNGYNKKPIEILTESDLHCAVYQKLLKIKNISSEILHSEIYWKNKNGKLVYRPDLSIIPKEDIVLCKEGKFEFDGKIGAILFEFKFGKSSHNKFCEDIEKDFNKFMELSKLNKEKIYCYFIILTKDNKFNSSLKSIISKKGKNFKFITNYH